MNRVLDLSDPLQKERLLDQLSLLQGRWRIEWVRYRPRRSDRQNRYYWPCFVEPFAQWISAKYGETIAPEQAHRVLKNRFLRRQVIDRETGEVLEWVGSTASLDTAQFNHYLDRVAGFLAEFCEIDVPPPRLYWEVEREASSE